MKPIIALVFFSICFLSGCFSSVDFKKPTGETADLWINNNIKYEVEMLNISDSTVCFLCKNKIYKLEFENIKQIYINGYSVSSIKIASLIIPLGLEIIITGAFIQEKRSNWLLYSLISSGVLTGTIIALISDNPKVDFRPPMNRKEMEVLSCYCRYSGTITPLLWKKLLTYYKQDHFMNYLDLINTK